jgi:F-type H+-transporting ATPase subunit delta
MSDHKVSIRYASSLLDSAIEKDNLLSVAGDMKLILDTLDANIQLDIMMKSPVVKPQVKLSVLNEIFKSSVGEETLHFLQFVISKKRGDIFSNIAKKFLELKDEHLGILNVEITSAYEFSEDQKEKIKQKFESLLNKTIILKFIEDKSLIGGFIARVADTMYDASIRHQLELLRKQFLAGNVSLN